MHSHIIFDLDGTLVESLPGIAEALNTALTELKQPTHSPQAIRSFIGDGSYMLCQRAAKGQSADVIESLHEAFLKEYPKSWKSGTFVFEGIHDLISKLQDLGCKLSILSNKPHAFTTEIVNHFFPEKPFDIVLGQRDGIAQKPDPSGVHEILGELGKSSVNTILVGDSTMDIITARNSGVCSLAVTWGYHDASQLAAVSPRHTAHSVSEMLHILTPKNLPAFR